MESASNAITLNLIVEKLRDMDEAALKLEYIRILKNELAGEWNQITVQSDLSGVSDEDIVKAVQKNRYPISHD